MHTRIVNLITDVLVTLISFSLLVAGTAHAESIFDLAQRHFHKVKQSEELPGRIVTAIVQDHSGYLWFGTQQGLARFDGYQFVTFNYSLESPSIAGDDIRALWVDSDNSLWIGTFSDGLSVLAPDRQSFFHLRHQPDNASSISDDWIRSIESDGTNHVWIGSDRGLDRYSKSSNIVTRVDSIAGCPNHVEGIRHLLRVQNQLWIAGVEGLCIANIDSFNESNRQLTGRNLTQVQGKEVVSIRRDSHRRIWLGTRQHGAFFINKQGQLQAIQDGETGDASNGLWISSITQVGHEIWLGTAGEGIIVVDIESGKVLQHIKHDPSVESSISINDISTMLVDTSGLLWIGTWGDGISRFNPVNSAFRSIRQTSMTESLLSHKDIQSILVTQDQQVWLGTRGGGIDVLDATLGKIKHFRTVNDTQISSGNDHITELAQTNDGTIWVGTRQQGLWRYQKNTDDFQSLQSYPGMLATQIISLATAPDGGLWIGSDQGIHYWDPLNDSFRQITDVWNALDAFDYSVWALTVSDTGRVWIGTSEGLYSIPPNESYIVRMDSGISDDARLSNKSIVDLMLDRYGLLWVSTVSGLDRMYEWQGEVPAFESIKHKIGLPSETVWGTLFQDAFGRVWTENHVIDTRNWRAHRLLAEDGWNIGNQWHGAVTVANDGVFMLGGTEGLLLVDPTRYQPWQFSPRLVINSVKINGITMPTEHQSQITLPPSTRSVQIEPVMLDYLRPEQIRFRYRLLGFDEQWTEVSARNRVISFTNLDTGKYQLEIQATNSVLEWQPDGLNITLRQVPAWHQTIIFKITVIIFIGLIIFAVYRLRIMQLEKQKAALDILVKKRTEDIVALGNIGQEITATLDLSEIAKQVYGHVREMMGADTFLLGVLDRNNTHINIKFIIEKGEKLPEFTMNMGDLNRAAVWCISNQKELITRQTSELLTYLDVVQPPVSGEQSESIIYLPLVIENHTLGCLSVQSRAKNAFDENQLQMLKTISSYAAIALDNANTHQQLTDTLNELQNKNEALAGALQEIEKISLVDQLTGANNRRFLEKFLPAEISKLKRAQKKNPNERIGFLLLDADHFKQVNDTYGHEAGDRVLVQIVEQLRIVCRESDWIIRMGGEEFLVIANVEKQDAIEVLAERIRETLSQHKFDLGDGQIIQKTCSVGACCYPFFAMTPDALRWSDVLNLADRALYAAKNHGRNAWVSIKQGNQPNIEYFQSHFQNLDAAKDRNIISVNHSTTVTKTLSFQQFNEDN